MKFMLIALNVFLAAAVVHLAWMSSSDPVNFASLPKSVSHAKVDKKKTSASTHSAKKIVVPDSPELTEKRIAALLERNIFNTQRVPDAPANRTNQRNNQQIRADMSLVGTYVIGDTLGAIILQRLQGNAQQQLKALQQKEYEQYSATASRVTDPKKRAEGAAEDDGANADVDVVEPGKERTIIMGNPSISANNVFRQHLKVGDTTVNGYKLVEVTRTSAVLTKNSERIELSLLTPSEAGNLARQRQNNNNNNNKNQQNNNNRNNNNNNNNRNNNNNNARNNNNNNRNNNNNARNNNNTRNNNNARNNNNNRNNDRNDWEWF